MFSLAAPMKRVCAVKLRSSLFQVVDAVKRARGKPVPPRLSGPMAPARLKVLPSCCCSSLRI